MPTKNDSDGLAALFLKHAGGYRSERALRERRQRILGYIQEQKTRLDRQALGILLEEIEEINIKLEVEHGRTQAE